MTELYYPRIEVKETETKTQREGGQENMLMQNQVKKKFKSGEKRNGKVGNLAC